MDCLKTTLDQQCKLYMKNCVASNPCYFEVSFNIVCLCLVFRYSCGITICGYNINCKNTIIVINRTLTMGYMLIDMYCNVKNIHVHTAT